MNNKIDKKSAKELFEDLGYYLYTNNDRITYKRKKKIIDKLYFGKTEDFEIIEFNLQEKDIYNYYCIASSIIPYEEREYLDLNEFKAILKQIEELNWNKSNEKAAKEIFAELGYVLKNSNDIELLYEREMHFDIKTYEGKTNDIEQIRFIIDLKEIFFTNCLASNIMPYHSKVINLNEYMAIGKQIEELKW